MDPYHLLSWKTAAAVLVVYFASLAFYRLYLHPLAKFPGPKLAAITRWYELYYDVIREGQYTFKIAELHKVYGRPIIRISPHELHILDHTFYEKLYCHEGRWNKYQWAYNGFIAEGATISTSEHELHHARRKPLNHYLSKARVASRQDVILRNVDKLVARLEGRVGTLTNLGAAVGALVQDLQCDFLLGKAYGSLDRDDFNVAIADMCQSVGFLWRFTKHFPRVGKSLKQMPLDYVSKFANDDAQTFFAFLQEVDKETEKLLTTAKTSTPNKDTSHTVIGEIVDSNLPPSDKELPRVLNEVQTLVGAGLETVSGVLRLMLYHVFNDAEILQNLRAELKTIDIYPGGGVDLKTLEQLPYLTACIMESMRLSPAIASRMARIVPDSDLYYANWCIPSGTPVGMTTIWMHLDENIYPEPHSFIPARWMNVEYRRASGKTYAPFSRGTRMCAGMYLAWADLYFTLAALAPRFNFKFECIQESDLRMSSDEFVIGTKSKAVLNCYVTRP
ncbi:cytochrome P450 [Paraphaeosphaeria sporulosa]|uniref:Cytochrome P450 n=1 Tax=Paraphaeosphaeria sporulosa TaxID=1460663 RepID=A0A177C397_9PLEO|nr:cytochrome P450 [Paraphaeosphaeria sporulosa]OAG01866.1 cytochrome P450 [Paraphaeosphaeria sporulosa]